MASGRTLRRTLDAVERVGASGEPVTASELADAMECTRRTAYDRLQRLAEAGELETKKVGARGRVWWRSRRTVGDGPIAEVLDRADIGVFVLDDEFDVAWANEATQRYFGVERDDVIGRDKRAVIDDVIADAIDDAVSFRERVFGTYDDNSYAERFECRVVPDDEREGRWLEHRSKPIETGQYAGGRVELYYDVTRRRETERVLDENERQFRTLVDATEEYAIYRLDPDGRIATWNRGAERITGYEREEVLGEHVSTFYTDEDVTDGVPEENLAAAAADGAIEDEGLRVRDDGTTFWASVTISAIYDDGDVTGFAAVTRDLTDRRKQERRLQHQRDELRRELDEVFERIDDAFYALDAELRFTYVNEQAEELLEREADELIGSRLTDTFPGTTLADQFRACLETQEPTSFETYSDRLSFWLEANVYPSESGLSVYFRDITEQKRREQELEQYERIVETVDDGVYALDDDARFVLANEAFCEMIGRDREDLMGEHATVAYEDDALAEQAAEAASRVSSGERDVATMEFDLVTADDERIPVENRFGPFPYGDGEGRCGVVRDVSERRRRERKLERQRERLEALNELNTIALSIAEAVVEQSTRKEIERIVCESLASSGSYEFAWIAGVDPAAQSVEPHVEVGVDGYLDGIAISVDPEDSTGRGPAGRAVQACEIQVVGDALEDPGFEPWRDVAREYGYRSAAAVPITHEGSIYGLLGVYADQPDAFGGEVRRVLHQLGEVTGHAIAAVERKRALIGDELVEVEFRIRDVFETLGVDGGTDRRITLDQTVPLSDGEYLVYGTATEDSEDLVADLVAAQPHWRDLSYVDGAPGKFEVTLDEPPVLTTVASLGGRVDEAVIEDGDYHMTIHLSPGVDVRQVIDTVREVYPNAEFVTRRQISRAEDADDEIRDVLTDDLTDRQWAALEAAHYAGFFEWPRENSGEEVAASLGIAAPTFHQHVRAAERKVFASLLGGAAPTTD